MLEVKSTGDRCNASSDPVKWSVLSQVDPITSTSTTRKPRTCVLAEDAASDSAARDSRRELEAPAVLEIRFGKFSTRSLAP